MPKAYHASYNLPFKSKLLAEAEAIVHSSEIAVDNAINTIIIVYLFLSCFVTSLCSNMWEEMLLISLFFLKVLGNTDHWLISSLSHVC